MSRKDRLIGWIGWGGGKVKRDVYTASGMMR